MKFPIIDDDVISRIKESIASEKFVIPDGLTKEQIVEFILQKADTKD